MRQRLRDVDWRRARRQVKYKLALKTSSEKGEKKKIYFHNVYDTPAKLNVKSNSQLVSTKESEVDAPAGEKVAIILRFVPVETPRQACPSVTSAPRIERSTLGTLGNNSYYRW